MPTELAASASLSNPRAEALLIEWKYVAENFSLTAPDAPTFAKSLPSDPGTYLWSVATRSAHVCLYVGKCRNFSKRMYAYTQSFQPHAPNDRKLAFTQIALRELFEDASFGLYFKACALSKIDSMETTAIADFSPILNRRTTHSAAAKAEFEVLYQGFYRRLLRRAFGEA
jgi:hypothetical protein